MRELPSIVLKEFNLIKSQRMTLALIIIYPLLVIGALGVAFGSQFSVQAVDVALFIPADTELGPFTAPDLVEIMENTKRVNIQLTGSREETEELVKSGKSDFGLVVREEKTATGQIVTDLLLDNSNFIVSGMFSPLAKASIQLTSFEVSSRLINQLWGELLPVRDDLQGELGKIDLYIDDMDMAGAKIDSLQQTVSNINVAQLRNTLNTQSSNVDSTKRVVTQFNEDYSAFKTDIADTKTDLERADSKLTVYEGDVSEQISLLQGYRDMVGSYETQLNSIASNPTLPIDLKAEVIELRDEVTQTRKDLENSIVGLQTVKSDIAESKQMLNSMRAKLNLAEARLDAEKNSLDGMNRMLDSTTGDISNMNTQIASLTQTVDEVNRLTQEANATKEDISEKLENSKKMLKNFMDTLGTLSDIDPSFLSHPIQAFEKNLYEEMTPLTFITPISLGLVLLLTCLLLTSVSVITEKREGAHLRMKLSSTSASTLIIGKIIGQLVFAFLVSGIILAIGLFVFNVQFQQNILEIIIAIAIASFSFIALGLFITNFAKTQSTAILSSLIIILPMIFLSGTILPLQLMNPILQTASGFLPLTAANVLLTGVLIKGIPLIKLVEQMAILLIPGIVLTAFTIKKF